MHKKVGLLSLFCGALGLCALTPAAHAGVFTGGGVGPDQNINITTSPDVGAHCIIKNKVGSTVAMHTPQSVNVMKSTGRTVVTCLSQDGIWHGAAVIRSNASGFGILYSLPWSVFAGVNAVAGGFSDPGGIDAAFAGSVTLPDKIVVKLESTVKNIPDAQIASRQDAIANQPLPDLSEDPAKTPTATAPMRHRHHHKVYHTENSHS